MSLGVIEAEQPFQYLHRTVTIVKHMHQRSRCVLFLLFLSFLHDSTSDRNPVNSCPPGNPEHMMKNRDIRVAPRTN